MRNKKVKLLRKTAKRLGVPLRAAKKAYYRLNRIERGQINRFLEAINMGHNDKNEKK